MHIYVFLVKVFAANNIIENVIVRITATPKDAKTEARYYICSDAGGTLPEWLKKAAATKTLPGTISDAVREGRKRAR